MKLTELGKMLRKIRIDRGERMVDMARKLEVSPAFLSSVETGRKAAPVRLIERLCNEYGLDQKEVRALERAVAETRDDFPIELARNAPMGHRLAAAALARRFPGMTEDQVQRIQSIAEEEDSSDE